jgi:hydrogenase assembly chaperone HypC/HupF
MCLSFPGTVVDVDGGGALVETEGRRRRASTLLIPDVRSGDRVVVAAGTIVERLDAWEAAEIDALLRTAIAGQEGERRDGAHNERPH